MQKSRVMISICSKWRGTKGDVAALLKISIAKVSAYEIGSPIPEFFGVF
jgi:hypothetical protein